MLGELIIKILVSVLGYVYPAFECFRSVERHRHDNARLMFWCQYWIIIAMVTAIEKFGDVFVSWVPLYGESKLAFIVYLWHPKTKGTNYVYNRVLRPFMAQHEGDIEKRLQGMMTKSIDLLLFYIKYFTDKGQSIAFEILQHVISRSIGSSSASSEKGGRGKGGSTTLQTPPPTPPQPSTSKKRSLFKRSPRQRSSSVEEATLVDHIGQGEDGDDQQQAQLDRIEAAFRAAGVNLKEISRSPTRSR